MSGRRGFVSAGCWTLDQIKQIDRWPREEALAEILSQDQHGGGSAHNFGIDMRKLDPDMPVWAMGLLGDDAAGHYLRQEATRVGMDVRQLHTATSEATSYTDVIADSGSGKRTFFHHPGCNDLLTPEHFDFTGVTAKTLHLGLLGLHRQLDSAWRNDANGWVTVLRNATAAGLQCNVELVSIAPQAIRDVCLPCLDWLDTLVINDYEAGSLANITTLIDGVANEEACQAAARHILSLSSRLSIVVVHYPQGACCVTRDGQAIQCPCVSTNASLIKGSVGAGDAFAAGFLYALHENWPLEHALQLAHASAAMCLRSATTTGAMQTVDACLTAAGYQRP